MYYDISRLIFDNLECDSSPLLLGLGMDGLFLSTVNARFSGTEPRSILALISVVTSIEVAIREPNRT